MTNSGKSAVTGAVPTDGGAFDVVVIGAGIAGVYSIFRLRKLGMRVRAFEQGDGIGGTWYWNRYPGARCDIPSWDYSYSFSEDLEQEWKWTERYATQPEILSYINHVADRFDLRKDIELGVRVEHVHFDDETAAWRVQTDDGRVVTARYVIAASGILSTVNYPDVPGLAAFRGRMVHTGQWPADGVDVAGLRVGLIGTASSGSQVAPWLGENAGELYVFQRRPVYAAPAHHRPTPPEEEAEVKKNYRERRAFARYSSSGSPVPVADIAGTEVDDETFRAVAEEAWAEGGIFAVQMCFNDIATDPTTNERLANFIREKIAERVEDPATAELLLPRDYPLGGKRLVVEEGYYETYNRPNVHLVNLKADPLERFTEDGLVAGGTEYPLDVIVIATGFDAVSGSVIKMDVRGRGGKPMAEAWADGAGAYLGISVPDFPNFFLVAGPGSPSAFSNLLTEIEFSLDYTADLIAYAQENDAEYLEADPAATQAWMDFVHAAAQGTVYASTDGWYNGNNIPGRPKRWTSFVAGVGTFRHTLEGLQAKGYPGYLFGIDELVPPSEPTAVDLVMAELGLA